MKNLILFPLVALLFTGCYTQVALEKNDRSNDKDYYYSDSENQSNDDYSYEESYSDTLYDKEGNEYHYHFYGYPFYRKYYWGYYPSVSILIGVGNPWYCYDPWYWDPWICGTWHPTIVYYPGYWHPGYFWVPWYRGNYWTYYTPIYKYRNNDGFRIRNSSGLRNSLVSRNSGSRGTDQLLRDQLKLRERSLLTRNSETRERTGLREQDRKSDLRNRTTDGMIYNRRNNEDNKNRNEVRNREQIRNQNDNTRKRNDIEIRKRTDEKRPPQIKRNEDTEKRTPRYNDSGNRNRTPERTYTPPRSYNPPRSNIPPQRQTTPPPSRNSSGGNRGNTSGDSDRSRR
jgi:hypothetical protein